MLVVIAPLLAALFRTSRMPTAAWLGLPLAMGGIYLLADPSIGGLNKGDWLTIGCALAFAAQMVALESAAKVIRGRWLLVYLQIFMVALGALAWCFIEGAPFRINAVGWAAVIYTAIFGGVLAIWLQTRYQPDVPAGHAALVFTLEPVFAELFAWMLLGDVWTGRGLIGAGFILAAMAVSSVAVGRER